MEDLPKVQSPLSGERGMISSSHRKPQRMVGNCKACKHRHRASNISLRGGCIVPRTRTSNTSNDLRAVVVGSTLHGIKDVTEPRHVLGHSLLGFCENPHA